jgi:hypothetical protein
MKIFKTLLFAIFLFSATSSTAQISKNTILLGGFLGLQFKTDKRNSSNTFYFEFSPMLGGFVAKNFALGVKPFFSYYQSKGMVNGLEKFNSTVGGGLGPYARYYVKIGEKIYFFGHADLSIGGQTSRYSTDKDQPRLSSFTTNWSLGPGLSFWVSKSVAVETSVYYIGNYHRENILNTGGVLSKGSPYIDHGMLLNLGFQIYFERNKKAD